MVSTPAGPGSLFYKIEAEPEDTCIYKGLNLDYTYGLKQDLYGGRDRASQTFTFV